MNPLRFMGKPFEKGHLHLKNRFVMPPMVTNYGERDGSMTDRQAAYYGARASGGVGLMIVEAAAVTPEGRGTPFWLSLYDDRFVPPLKRITQQAHLNDVKILIQLAHAGGQTSSEITGSQPLSASNAICPPFKEVPRALSTEEIKLIIQRFGAAARRAYASGFDGVEVHGAHGYLIHQFLSPKTNTREDEYGGPLENRMRFGLETIRKVREAVGPDVAVVVRVAGNDFVPDSHTNLESRKFAA